LSPAGRRSGFNTPRSCGFESHPMVVDAWESLRRTLVYFRSQPVGTIAALDHSVEELNYDQVNSIPFSFCFLRALFDYSYSIVAVLVFLYLTGIC
jgi:hypothetical protein